MNTGADAVPSLSFTQRSAVEEAVTALNTWYRNGPMPYADQTRIAEWLKQAFLVEAAPEVKA